MNGRWEAGVRDPARLAALERSGLVGSGPDDAFDRLIELAVEIVGAPRACITLVDNERTTAMSAVGFPEGAPLFAPIEQSFCRFVVGSGRPLIVDDARRDPRTIGDPAIDLFAAGAWAGYPIEDADGAILGTFCLMDERPHEWRPADLLVLATLAKAASSEIALHAARALSSTLRAQVSAERSAAEQMRSLVAEHVEQLMALGGPAAGLATTLLARLDAVGPRPP